MGDLIQSAIDDLCGKYHPHTVILYGSYARGEPGPESDIDFACFSDDAVEQKDARLFQGVYLDAWVYPSSALEEVPQESLRFGDGIAVVDNKSLGEAYLTAVREKIAQGPDPRSQSELRHSCEWIQKMLSRSQSANTDSRYRRTWLQFELLELYFELRNLWFLGHKKSFAYLAEHDETGLALFESMYNLHEDYSAMKAVAEHVMQTVELSGNG